MSDSTIPERLHIVCKTSADDATEVELPMRMLFVGDFVGEDDRPQEERVPVQVSRDTFGKVLAALAPRLDVTVGAGPEGSAFRAKLTFRQLSDFGPDAVAEQVPELQRMLSLRDALTSLKSTGNVEAFRAMLADLVPDAAARSRLLSTLGLPNP